MGGFKKEDSRVAKGLLLVARLFCFACPEGKIVVIHGNQSGAYL